MLAPRKHPTRERNVEEAIRGGTKSKLDSVSPWISLSVILVSRIIATGHHLNGLNYRNRTLKRPTNWSPAGLSCATVGENVVTHVRGRCACGGAQRAAEQSSGQETMASQPCRLRRMPCAPREMRSRLSMRPMHGQLHPVPAHSGTEKARPGPSRQVETSSRRDNATGIAADSRGLDVGESLRFHCHGHKPTTERCLDLESVAAVSEPNQARPRSVRAEPWRTTIPHGVTSVAEECYWRAKHGGGLDVRLQWVPGRLPVPDVGKHRPV